MKESLDNVVRELRKVDHLIFVSLKYTRTADVLKHIIKRMISAFDFMMGALFIDFKKKKKNKKIEIPKTPGQKVNLLKEIFKKDDTIQEFIQFYLNLRKIDRADYTKCREYRRHVTMTVVIEGKTQEITIDSSHEFYDKSKQYLEYIKTLLKVEND